MAFSDEVIQTIWEKARAMPGRDSTVWRKDQCGAWLRRDHYGSTESEYGWTIRSVAPGGRREVDTLQPFHWQNTFDVPNAKAHCHVTAHRDDLAPGQQVDPPRNTSV